VELKSIILSSCFEIIASKSQKNKKEKKVMAVPKKRTLLNIGTNVFCQTL
jgi:hypothetical protein